ncbi:hypothetical protein BDR26DRAFT_856707 [Obelidium mucronatum]|nr:hypothetical protein BDR26DRAFT_856707 [Obelidium mucronatum]
MLRLFLFAPIFFAGRGRLRGNITRFFFGRGMSPFTPFWRCAMTTWGSLSLLTLGRMNFRFGAHIVIRNVFLICFQVVFGPIVALIVVVFLRYVRWFPHVSIYENETVAIRVARYVWWKRFDIVFDVVNYQLSKHIYRRLCLRRWDPGRGAGCQYTWSRQVTQSNETVYDKAFRSEGRIPCCCGRRWWSCCTRRVGDGGWGLHAKLRSRHL